MFNSSIHPSITHHSLSACRGAGPVPADSGSGWGCRVKPGQAVSSSWRWHLEINSTNTQHHGAAVMLQLGYNGSRLKPTCQFRNLYNSLQTHKQRRRGLIFTAHAKWNCGTLNERSNVTNQTHLEKCFYDSCCLGGKINERTHKRLTMIEIHLHHWMPERKRWSNKSVEWPVSVAPDIVITVFTFIMPL